MDDGQSFGEPQIVAPGGGHADAPKIAVDTQGRLHLVYGESHDSPFQHYHIRYARRDAGSDRFSEPRTIAAPHGGVDSVNFPDLAVDGADRVYVVWERFADRRGYARGLGFTMSHDAGESFAEAEVVPGSDDPDLGANANRQGNFTRKLDVNDDGALAVVNSTFDRERSSHVWLWRSQATEAPPLN